MKQKTPEVKTISRFFIPKPRAPYFWNKPNDLIETQKLEAFKYNSPLQPPTKWYKLIPIFLFVFTIGYLIKTHSNKKVTLEIDEIVELNEILIIEKRTIEIKKIKKSYRPDYIEILADSFMGTKQYKRAFKRYAKLKTERPYKWRPRIKLYYAYSECCLETGKYCGNAQKEFRYLLKYLPKGEGMNPIREELFKNRNRVRRKVISIFRARGEYNKILSKKK